MIPEIWSATDNFLPFSFYPPHPSLKDPENQNFQKNGKKTPKNQNFEKMKKLHGDIII